MLLVPSATGSAESCAHSARSPGSEEKLIGKYTPTKRFIHPNVDVVESVVGGDGGGGGDNWTVPFAVVIGAILVCACAALVAGYEAKSGVKPSTKLGVLHCFFEVQLS